MTAAFLECDSGKETHAGSRGLESYFYLFYHPLCDLGQ